MRSLRVAALALPLLAGLSHALDPKPGRGGFPRGFWWGVGTAAYQNEGFNTGSDLWDWERKKGWDPSGRAADSWDKPEADLAGLKELGANAYRFSMEWGRVVPGPGRPDEAALSRYGRLLKTLRASGIRPVVTIHHFTNPAWFWKRHPDGWRDAGAVDDYLEFVGLLAERFGRDVDEWIAFNEPNVYLLNGYLTGHFPPGERRVLDLGRLLEAQRNLVAAQRGAHRLLHRLDRYDADGDGTAARVGVAQHLCVFEPLRDEPADRAAAERWERFFNWSFLDASQTGRWDGDLDGAADGRIDGEGRGFDFVGINYYTRVFVRSFPIPRPARALALHADLTLDRWGALLYRLAGGRPAAGPADDVGRELHPDGLRLVSRRAWERFGLPVLITENGLPDRRDALKAGYIAAHLERLKAAIDEGVPVLGYLHWTLVDNYEWGSFEHKTGLYRLEKDGSRKLTEGGRAYRVFLRGR